VPNTAPEHSHSTVFVVSYTIRYVSVAWPCPSNPGSHRGGNTGSPATIASAATIVPMKNAATALLIFGVIFGGIELSLFVSTRSVISPAIVAILFGGVIFSLVPATLTNLALVAVLLLLGGLGLLVAYRSGS